MSPFQEKHSRFHRDSRHAFGHRFQVDKPNRDWPWFVGAVVVSAFLVAVMATEARADSPITQGINLGSGTQAGAAAGAWSDSSSISNGGSGYGGMGGAGGAATNAGNAQSLTVDQVKQSPAMFMQAPMPTAPCQASVGGFLSFIGGAGFAYSRTLKECELRELARISHGVGQTDLAKHVLCKAEYAKDFEGCQQENQK